MFCDMDCSDCSLLCFDILWCCRLYVVTNVSEEYAAFTCIVKVIVLNSTRGTLRIYILEMVKFRN